jgi:hypothetical protein
MPRRRMAGSSDVTDRDVQRVESDLIAVARRYPATRSRAAKRSWTWFLPGTRSTA